MIYIFISSILTDVLFIRPPPFGESNPPFDLRRPTNAYFDVASNHQKVFGHFGIAIKKDPGEYYNKFVYLLLPN